MLEGTRALSRSTCWEPRISPATAEPRVKVEVEKLKNCKKRQQQMMDERFTSFSNRLTIRRWPKSDASTRCWLSSNVWTQDPTAQRIQSQEADSTRPISLGRASNNCTDLAMAWTRAILCQSSGRWRSLRRMNETRVTSTFRRKGSLSLQSWRPSVFVAQTLTNLI